MVFSSMEFICVFFPIVFLINFIVNRIHFKNILLLLSSLIFYAYGEPIYVLLMVASAGFNYIFAIIITKIHRSSILFLCITINLGILFYFKYTIFFIGTLAGMTGLDLKVPDIKLPIGISFFTFQALSYIIDIYRGNVKVQKNFLNLLLYISFFPQLIAGPIVKYKDISEELEYRKMDIKHVAEGIRRFICGLGKKVLIANTMGAAADAVFNANNNDINIFVAWLGAVSYMLQIYYDFSGYSDMAIGLGKIYGFSFHENFRYPYGATSIKEFWHRWHISLSTWFKEYLYIPLGGNRKGRVRTYINKFIVFFCTGIWHGADWTFIIWGLYHGFFLVIEDIAPLLKKMPQAVSYLYTMLVVCIGFVFFRSDTVSQGIYIIEQMFTGFSYNSAGISLVVSQLTPWFIVMLFSGIIGMVPVMPLAKWIKKLENSVESRKYYLMQVLSYIFSALMLIWCIIRLSGNTYNPFIYFRF
ncbi:MAG: MBOAT family protein [Clostridia bacterium]|nr:MBOAT family protein [Clostridia bacterium]